MIKVKSTISKLEEFGSTVAFITLILLLVFVVFDIYNFSKEPENYINVHHLDVTKKNWKWVYLQNSINLAVVFIGGIFIYSLSFLKKENRPLITLRSIFTLILFGSLFYGYYQWYLTGFDH